MMLTFAVALVGAALVRQLPEHDKWGRYAGTCLMGANSASFPLLMSMVSGNIGGFTKKTTVNAMVSRFLASYYFKGLFCSNSGTELYSVLRR